MFKRWLTLLLSFCLLLSLIPSAFAQGSETEAGQTELPPDSSGYGTVTTSETVDSTQSDPAQTPLAARSAATYTTSTAGIAYIEAFEGVSMDHFGANALSACEASVNAFLTAYSVTVSQAQFDALVDLQFNCSGCFSGLYRFSRLLIAGGYTDTAFADALCVWSTVGGTTSAVLVERRYRDAMLFLYGDYTGKSCTPTFRYAIFNANGGTPEEKVCCYTLNACYTSLPSATWTGAYFAGWYTAAQDGTQVANQTVVSANQTLYAHWSDTAVTDPNELPAAETGNGDGNENNGEMTFSEDGITFLKGQEGFAPYAVWDYHQYSIGYGTGCGKDDYPNGITEEEADALLRQVLPSYEQTVRDFAEKNNLTLRQNQFDALVSFTYNLGAGWTSGCRMVSWILNPGTDLAMVDAMGAWCHAGDAVLGGLVSRRIREAQIYLYGSYTGTGCPQYQAVWFRANGGTIEGSTATSEVRYYNAGTVYGVFPTVFCEDYTLTGWFDSKLNGTQVTEAAKANSYQILYAHWEESGMSFTDIRTTDWYYPYVKTACEYQLFSGTSDTEFGPNVTMTRAMLVTVLYRLAGSPEASGSAPFTDVVKGEWYADAVLWAYQNGIVSGVSTTRFGTAEPVTREQLATILYRYAGKCGYDTTATASLSAYSDAGRVSSYAADAMKWAVGKQIISGMTATTLGPKGKATRAQVATIFACFIETFKITIPA